MLFGDCCLWVHDMRIRDGGDEAISERHECIDHSPALGSSVNLVLLRSQSTFP